MGGKLFEKEGAIRISTVDYEEKYIPLLQKFLEPLGLRYSFVDYYSDKESHGDIDVVVNKMTILEKSAIISADPDRKKVLLNYLRENGYKAKVNSSVVSFLFENKVQVDLIFTKPDLYNYSVAYFSYQDLGGLLGRISRGLNLKHGSNGLSYVLYNEDKTRKLNEYTLNLDHDKTLEILGLSVERFKEGFKSLEDIFEYVVTSKYFGTKPFILSENGSKDRHRDQKRNTFIKFDQYVKDNVDKFPLTSKNLPDNKREFLYTLFPTLKAQVERDLKFEEEKVLVAKKFNGHILMNTFEVFKNNPKLLGGFIKSFKDEYSHEVLLEYSDSEVIAEIQKHFKKWDSQFT